MSLFTASMEDKLVWLLAEAVGVLDSFNFRPFLSSMEPDYKLMKEGGDESIAESNRIMGEPIAFVRVLHEGSDDFGPLNLSNQQAKTSHFFGVQVWFEIEGTAIESDNGKAQYAQAGRLFENKDLGGLPLGLLPHLRQSGTFQTSGGEVVEVGKPREVRRVDVVISGEIICQYIEFTITLT